MAALPDVKSSPSMQKARLELWVQIVVAEQDHYTPVPIEDKADCQTGGIFVLRQGERHYVLVKVIPSIGSEKGPVTFSHVTSVSLGSICLRSKNDEPLDSYQKNDVERVKEVWALAHINRLCDASEVLTTDRPSVPCSPVHWQHQPGMEERIPLVLLHLTEDADLDSMINTGELVGENSDDMIKLVLIEKREHQQKMHKQCEAVASLDSSTHITDSLKQVTPDGTRIYAILKVGVLLGNPSVTEINLRKRIALKVHRKGVLRMTKMRPRYHGKEARFGCGVTFEVVFRTSNKKIRNTSSSLSVPSTQKPSCRVGDTVLVQLNRGLEKGIIKFVGKTNFAAGDWVGIELDHCYGKHNGTYNDEKYFECKENHGIFILKEEVIDSFSSLLIRSETCPNLKELTRHPKYGRVQKQFPIHENLQETHFLPQGSDSPNLTTGTDGEENRHSSPSMITSTPVSSSSGGVTKPEYPKTKGSLSMPSSSGSSLESDSHFGFISSAGDCSSHSNSVNDVLSITKIIDEADGNGTKLTENLCEMEMKEQNLENEHGTLKTSSPIGKPLEGITLSPVLFSQTSMSSCQAKVFGKKSDSNVYHFDFVFLKDLQSYNMAIGQKYSEWSEVVPVTFVKFEEESIKIDISADNAGWTAVCLSPNKIYQIAADSESNVEQCCRIEVQWTGDEKPKHCHYPVILSGALDSPKFQLPLPLPTNCNFSIGPPITSQPTLQQLLNNIAFPAEDKFVEIGLGLRFELPNLRAIEQQFNKKYSHCFLEMFDRWLKSGDDSVNWETIFNVLASESVGRDDLAKSIRRRLSSASKIE